MTHPLESQLALYAGGDLSFLERLRIRRHISGCDYCRREADAFRAARNSLCEASGSLPEGLAWERLAAEMTANIHVGLEAGECVGSTPIRMDRVGWRAAAVMAGMACLLITAWWLNPPQKPQHGMKAAAQVEIRSTSSGIEVNENGHVLALMHTRGGRQKPIIISAPGTLRARFVDSETGQVTINNVYTE
jgi:anti-sigma factor RsiW